MRRLMVLCCVLGVLGLLVPLAGCGSGKGKDVDPVVVPQQDKQLPEIKPVQREGDPKPAQREGDPKPGQRPAPKVDAN
jgi:hypothetical protein